LGKVAWDNEGVNAEVGVGDEMEVREYVYKPDFCRPSSSATFMGLSLF
jgi:hypothetical protein